MLKSPPVCRGCISRGILRTTLLLFVVLVGPLCLTWPISPRAVFAQPAEDVTLEVLQPPWRWLDSAHKTEMIRFAIRLANRGKAAIEVDGTPLTRGSSNPTGDWSLEIRGAGKPRRIDATGEAERWSLAPGSSETWLNEIPLATVFDGKRGTLEIAVCWRGRRVSERFRIVDTMRPPDREVVATLLDRELNCTIGRTAKVSVSLRSRDGRSRTLMGTACCRHHHPVFRRVLFSAVSEDGAIATDIHPARNSAQSGAFLALSVGKPRAFEIPLEQFLRFPRPGRYRVRCYFDRRFVGSFTLNAALPTSEEAQRILQQPRFVTISHPVYCDPIVEAFNRSEGWRAADYARLLGSIPGLEATRAVLGNMNHPSEKARTWSWHCLEWRLGQLSASHGHRGAYGEPISWHVSLRPLLQRAFETARKDESPSVRAAAAELAEWLAKKR